ncbi:MAG: Hsp70 family protein [Myxococcota bacterium]
MASVVGIDLGTSYSSVATCSSERVGILADDEGQAALPTVVAYRAGQPPLVGRAARPFLVTDPENTVYSFKRLMGRRMGTPEVRVACAAHPFRVVEGPAGQAVVKVAGTQLAIPQVAADVLRHLKGLAEARLGHEVRDVCITVPANFDDVQREATDVACRLARLNARRILNEPTAAAMAFGYGANLKGRIAVYDFGGGTFDFTILEAEGPLLRVLATAGDPFLGGDDVDLALARAVARHFWRTHDIELQHHVVSWQRLVMACEELKRTLSVAEVAPLHLPEMASGPHGPIALDLVITRPMLEEAAAEHVARSLHVCQDVLDMASVPPSSLDAVVLVGGTTLMPAVRNAVQRYFGQAPDTRMDPLAAVAAGAAIQGMILQGGHWRTGTAATLPTLLLDVTPHSLGIETPQHGFLPVIARNTPIPVEQVRTFFTSMDGQTELTLRVYQGESTDARENTYIGELRLVDLPPSAEGEVAVEVTFEIDVGGRIHLSARHVGSGKVCSARLRLAAHNAITGLPA